MATHRAKVYSYLPKNGHQQCISPSTDSLSADENDHVNSTYAEKKENSSSKRYGEMTKLSFGNCILVTDWNTVHCQIAHYQYWNSWLCTNKLYTVYFFSNFLAKELIYNLTIEIYASFPICVLFPLLPLQIIYQILGWWDMYFFKKRMDNMIWYIFNVLIRNNE